MTSRSIFVSFLLLWGCSGKAEGNTPPGAAQESAQTTTTPAANLDGARKVLTAYEIIRGQLARDELASVAASAEALGKAATDAAAQKPGALEKHLAQIATAARALAKLDAKDADGVRRGFGETSRHVVAMLAAEPALRRGMHLFHCPMAQGYQKWVQPGEKVENPYMGQKMLACGAGSDWNS